MDGQRCSMYCWGRYHRGSLVGDRSRVGVVTSAYWSSRNGLRPSSVERGDGDDN
jgi:hypothetical protein